jgi:hypothetical protein
MQKCLVFCVAVLAAIATVGRAAGMTREEMIARSMTRYDGPTVKGVDAKTLDGKVMCGYQGWFACPGDGSERGWHHWGGSAFEPGRCTVDFWPDMSEYDADEKFATAFRHADGSTAYVFSPMNRKTVLRHFKWMADYGIDGAFVQRFAVETTGVSAPYHRNVVLAHCREGANRYGRAYAVMYDLSGLRAGGTAQVIEDWKLLVDKMGIGRDARDAAYLHHGGRPVVAVWGIGFSDGRAYTVEECLRLVEFLKDDPAYGGFTVMVGVPTYWRTLSRDCVNDPLVHEIARKADIVSPWMVGRFGRPEDAARIGREVWQGDMAWCSLRGKDYLPVVWPGFSWSNQRRRPEVFDQIPRLGGRFLWAQYLAAKEMGARMIYQAMFDEVDEGTAIFKCTNDVPVGGARFVTYEGLPSDHYLWLAGQGGRLIRDEIEATDALPERK